MKEKPSEKSKPIKIVKALIMSYIITTVLVLVIAFLLYKFQISLNFVHIGIIITYIGATFVGGIIAGKSFGEKKFVWGLIIGILYFTIIMVVSFIINKKFPDNIASLSTTFVICSISGMLGGMLS